MLIVRKKFVLVGLFLCLISGILPMLKIPIKGNWNLYQTDEALFFITYIIVGITGLLFFVRQLGFYRLMARVTAVWYLISVSAVFFKINNYFGWKFADGILSKSIHMRWGWIVYLLGVLCLLLSTWQPRKMREGAEE